MTKELTPKTSSIKIVPKGWGHEKWIVNNEKYCGKLLFIEKNKRCSWHYHKIKDETFYLQSGLISLYYGFDEDIGKAEMIVLEPGDQFHVPVGLKHQMVALLDSELFEFSTQHFDSDSHRIRKGD
jgi:mannose-6-phosphate isomerase-like protein (cupin superfamily)